MLQRTNVMRNSFPFYALTCALLVCAGTERAFAEPSCTETDTTVFYGNGVLTDRVGAFLSLTALQDHLAASLSDQEYQKLDFRTSLNASGGTIADLFESAIQDISTDVSSFWRWMSGIWVMPEWFRDRIVDAAAVIDEAALLMDLGTHVANYRSSILEGRRVVLVAHSQGNFFANQAYAHLTTAERASFGIVSVANPDSDVATRGNHTTLFEDLVIAAIRAVKIAIGAWLLSVPPGRCRECG